VSAAIYFVSAGRTNLPLAWAYFGIDFGGVIFSIVLEIVNPGQLQVAALVFVVLG